MRSLRRHRLPGASGPCWPTTRCRCRAAPRSSIPRTPPRSSPWPTSSPAPACVEAGVGSGALTCCAAARRRRARACLLLRAARGLRRDRPQQRRDASSAARTRLAPDGRRPREDALGETDVDRVVLDMLAPWECVDAVAQALMPGGRGLRLRRHHDPAVPHRRGSAGARRVHRALCVGDHGPRLARRGTGRPARPPDGRPHRVPGHRPPPGRRGDAAGAPQASGQGRPGPEEPTPTDCRTCPSALSVHRRRPRRCSR